MAGKKIEVDVGGAYKATLTLPSNRSSSTTQEALQKKVQEVVTEIFKNETFQEATRILTTLTNPVLDKSYELVATFDSKEQLMRMTEYGDIDQKINELRALIWSGGSMSSKASNSSIPNAPKLPQTPSKSQQFLSKNNGAKRVLPPIPSNGLPALRKVLAQRNRQGSANAAGQTKLATRTNDSIPKAPCLDPLLDLPSNKPGRSLSGKIDKRNVMQDIQQNIADARARRLALPTKQNNPALQSTSLFPRIRRGSDSGELSRLLQEKRQQDAQTQQENLIGQGIRDKVESLEFDSQGNIVYEHVEASEKDNEESAELTITPMNPSRLEKTPNLELFNKINRISDNIDQSISLNTEKIDQDDSLREIVDLYQDFRTDILAGDAHTANSEYLPEVLKTLQSYAQKIFSKLTSSTKNDAIGSVTLSSEDENEVFSPEQLAYGSLTESHSDLVSSSDDDSDEDVTI